MTEQELSKQVSGAQKLFRIQEIQNRQNVHIRANTLFKTNLSRLSGKYLDLSMCNIVPKFTLKGGWLSILGDKNPSRPASVSSISPRSSRVYLFKHPTCATKSTQNHLNPQSMGKPLGTGRGEVQLGQVPRKGPPPQVAAPAIVLEATLQLNSHSSFCYIYDSSRNSQFTAALRKVSFLEPRTEPAQQSLQCSRTWLLGAVQWRSG